VDGKEIVHYTLEAVAPWVDGIVLVMPPGGDTILGKYTMIETDVFFTTGGATRYDSIKAGFRSVPEGANIMVVDAVRCNTHERVFANLFKALENAEAAFPFLMSVSTMCRMVGEKNKLEIFNKTHSNLMEVQTPEIVRYNILGGALEVCGPDDGFSVIHMVGVSNPVARIAGFPGPYDNFKITYPTDLMLFTMIVEMKKAMARREKDVSTKVGGGVGDGALPRGEQREGHPQVQN
jgi:2-C-methyl-D-erythritol 4-phosphate cytidylyltransferase